MVVVLASKKCRLREFSRRLFFKIERSVSLLHSAADDDHDDHDQDHDHDYHDDHDD